MIYLRMRQKNLLCGEQKFKMAELAMSCAYGLMIAENSADNFLN